MARALSGGRNSWLTMHGRAARMTWREFWNSDTPIYVNARHKHVHYRGIARDIARLVPGPDAHVLDYGSGEATSADQLALVCGRLYLSDGAALVRGRLAERFRDIANIAILSPEETARIADDSLDLIVMNSLLQYLSPQELERLLATLKPKLKASGRLLLADVLPRDLSPVTDALALLRFGASHGFFMAAVLGLVRTALSDYRKTRAMLGLSQYAEDELIAILRRNGFAATRYRPNPGHNQARMAFLAHQLGAET